MDGKAEQSLQSPTVTGENNSGLKIKPSVPPNWTTLYHGTNLAKPDWIGKSATLDQDQLTIETKPGILGLSAITEEDREKDQRLMEQGHMYDTTASYSRSTDGKNTGQPVEIRVVFPGFHSRRLGTKEILANYVNLYGQERASSILELADNVHWRLESRHAMVPKGMVLDKLESFVDPSGKRVVTYVPHILKDVYERDLQDMESRD